MSIKGQNQARNQTANTRCLVTVVVVVVCCCLLLCIKLMGTLCMRPQDKYQTVMKEEDDDDFVAPPWRHTTGEVVRCL